MRISPVLLAACLAGPVALPMPQAKAAMECLPRMAAYRPAAPEPLREERPCPSALLFNFFTRQTPPLGHEFEIVGSHLFTSSHDGSYQAIVEFRLIAPNGQGYGPDGRICPQPAAAADMQVQFVYDDVEQRWLDLDSRGSMDPATLCQNQILWSAQEIADLIHKPRFASLPPAERGRVYEVARGPERRAILDAVRAANADLNDRVPIVFVVDILRADGTNAYFRGKVRLRDGGGPMSAADWGACEQEPEDAVLEALLERRNGVWTAIKANRCADDVLLSDEDRRRFRALVMEN